MNRIRSELPVAAATVTFIASIAMAADVSGVFFIMFPELAALAHDTLKRPHGAWARAPVMLVVTPVLTGAAGIAIARVLPYSPLSVSAITFGAIGIIRLLRSPIAPGISAGLLPLTLGVTSWWYPVALLAGLVPLAAIAAVRGYLSPPAAAAPVRRITTPGHTWVMFYAAFLLLTATAAWLTGWRFLLFPPLAVIAFEMFAHASTCPWAARPLALPVACALTATTGLLLVLALGAVPLAAGLSVAIGILVLRVLSLHVPPALAVGLLPMVIEHPGAAYPISACAGTALLSAMFVLWRRFG